MGSRRMLHSQHPSMPGHLRVLSPSFTSRRLDTPVSPTSDTFPNVYPEWLSNRKDFQDLRSQYEHLDKIDIYSVCLKPAASRSDYERKAVMRFMKSCPYFASMKEDQLADISDRLLSIRFEKDEILIRKGEIADCMYMIVKGKNTSETSIK